MEDGRSPCRERGLKYNCVGVRQQQTLSLPVQGAWIEMLGCANDTFTPARSLPVQGAWIEMSTTFAPETLGMVAPRAGSVD